MGASDPNLNIKTGKESSIYGRNEDMPEKSLDDVKEFVRAARKCEFDVDLAYNSAVVDGKSILGVFALGLENLCGKLSRRKPGVSAKYPEISVIKNFKQGFTNRKKSVYSKGQL